MSAPALEDVQAAVAQLVFEETNPHPVLDASEARGVKTPHVQLVVSRRYFDTRRGGRDTRRGYRIRATQVGESDYDVRELNRNCDTALSGVEVVVGSLISTPIAFESDADIGEDPDTGTSKGQTVWTFAL